MRLLEAVAALLLAGPARAVAQDRFLAKLTLPTGQTLVVAEGDFEARSIGSFSVRLYEAAPAGDETTFFSDGLIRARDGVIEQAVLADLDGDSRPEVVVIVRSAGSGGYQSAHAFAIADDKMVFLAMVEGLAADADPVAALRMSRKREE